MLRGIYMVALAWLVIVPLDAARFHWSPAFPIWLKAVGGLMLLPALYLIQRATMENTYLSTLVRIQDDRGQHVISTGVYAPRAASALLRVPADDDRRAAARRLRRRAADYRSRQPWGWWHASSAKSGCFKRSSTATPSIKKKSRAASFLTSGDRSEHRDRVDRRTGAVRHADWSGASAGTPSD